MRTARTAEWEPPWRDPVLGLAAALAALAVYLMTLARAVTGEDAGELIVAAWSLGIPHPPGYPLWCLLAHPFTWIDAGTVAWRVALSSAVFAAATVFTVVLLLRALGCGRLAAAGGALALAFSFEFWEQAVIPEVYTLNLLCVALCLLLLFHWHTGRSPVPLYALAVIYGLALGNHGTMVLLGPVFALFVLAADRPRHWRRYALLTGIAALTAFTVYTYLPIRSLADPPIDWGNPETLGNWWRVVRREQYAFMFHENPRSWARFGMQMAAFGDMAQRQFTPWVGGVGALGLLALVSSRPWHGLLLVTSGLLTLAGFSYVQNFDQSVEWLWVMSVFGLPAWLALAAGVGVALEWASRLGRGATVLTLVLACAAVGLPLTTHWEHNDRSKSFTGDDYARNLVEPLARDAIVITDTDAGAFGGLYLQAVEGIRTDVTLGRVNGHLAPELLADAPEELREAAGPFPRRREEPRIFAWLLEATDRPLYFERRPGLPADAPPVRWVREGLAWRALRAGEQPAEVPPRLFWRSLEEDAAAGDYTARAVVLALRLTAADEALKAGRDLLANQLVTEGLDTYGRDVRSLNNAGTLYARHKRREAAAALFEEALALDPGNGTVRRNLERLGDPEGAGR